MLERWTRHVFLRYAGGVRRFLAPMLVVCASALAQSQPQGKGPARHKRVMPVMNTTPTSPLAADPNQQEALRAAVQTAHEEQRAMRTGPVEAAPEPAKAEPPPTPGNDIYRWVDSRGVVHYSTNVPPHLKGVATKVGASRHSP